MKISELIEILNATFVTKGDIPVVLWDMDTSYYFTFNKENIEFQLMEDHSNRISIGVNEFHDPREPHPIARKGF